MRAVLVLLLCALALAAASEGGSASSTEQATPGSVAGALEGLTFKALFPRNPELVFVAGAESELLIGFVNPLDRYINLTYVEATLRSLHDDSEIVQNFTRFLYGVNLPGAGTSVAIDYPLKPDVMLDAISYALVAHVWYLDGTQAHTEVVFNGTVTVSAPEGAIVSVETVFLLAMLLGGAGALGYFVVLPKLAKTTKAKKTKDEREASSEAWLDGTLAATKKSPKKTPSKKNN